MMLAAFDGDALYQLVILVLLGAGGLVKKFIERQQAGQGGAGAGEDVTRRRREDTRQRLAELEEEAGEVQGDPWLTFVEGEGPAPTDELPEGALLFDPNLLEEPVAAAAAPTRERSIEGGALEEFSLEGTSFDDGDASAQPWEPGERIRESVFDDIEQSVSQDITQHVDADMSGGVRGEAAKTTVPAHRRLRARRGWRDAVIVAEVLGSPVSLRGPASQPAGLRSD